VFVDVDVKFFAIPLIFPVGDFVAETEEVGIAAKVEIADEHAAEMTKVADLVITEAESAEKCQRGHNRDNGAKAQGNRNGKEKNAAVGEQNRAGDHDSEDGAGGSDGGNVVGRLAPECWNGANDYVQNARANASQKVVAKKTVSSPDEFELAAKHPQHEHIDQDVPDVIDAVQEEICKRLPDAETRNYAARNQPEPHFKLMFGKNAAKIMDEQLQEKNCEVGDDEKLHTRSDVEVEAEAVVPDAGAWSHTQISLRVKRAGSKGSRTVTDYKSARVQAAGRRRGWFHLCALIFSNLARFFFR
jgi:hypothetical protein